MIVNLLIISDSGGEITYGRLYEFVSWLSTQLRSAGIGRGDIVAIYGDRVPSVVWAIMAVLSSGAAFSMMDPQYPTDRLVACLTIARPRAWIAMQSANTISDDLAAFLDQKLNLVARFTLPPLDHLISVESLQCDSRLETCDDTPEVTQDDIAVVTFTSGSTGLPKGVCGRHGPLTHFYPWMGETFHFSSDDHFRYERDP
jgi:L-aminoadipate-semialdehyde dehydrogenase